MNNNPSIFANAYQKYSPMLFTIAMEITSGEKQAVKILKDTFKAACDQSMFEKESSAHCFPLIRLMIKELYKEIELRETEKISKLKHFEQTPLLQYLLCRQLSLDDHCIEKEISREEGARRIRDEFNTMRSIAG